MQTGQSSWDISIRDSPEIARLLFARDVLRERFLTEVPPLVPEATVPVDRQVPRPTPEEWRKWWVAASNATLHQTVLPWDDLPPSVRRAAEELQDSYLAWPGRDVNTSIDVGVAEAVASHMQRHHELMPRFRFFLVPAKEEFVVTLAPDAVLCDGGIIASESRVLDCIGVHIRAR